MSLRQIVKNAIARLNKYSTLDEIKTTLKEECDKAPYEVTKKEWNELFNDVLIGIRNKKTNMNFEDMKRQLVAEGDYTRSEVEAMAISEVLAAWIKLPYVI